MISSFVFASRRRARELQCSAKAVRGHYCTLYANRQMQTTHSGQTWAATDTLLEFKDRQPFDCDRLSCVQSIIAGILASANGAGYLVTDRTWKCTADYHGDWTLANFNDAAWPPAAIIAPNLPDWPSDWPNRVHDYMPEIISSAQWIWTDNYIRSSSQPIDLVVYCRGRLRTFTFTDSASSVYLQIFSSVVKLKGRG